MVLKGDILLPRSVYFCPYKEDLLLIFITL